MGCAPPRAPRRLEGGRGAPGAPRSPTRPAPRLPRPPTTELRDSVLHFSFNPTPRHFLRKTETTRTCLKETAHLSALKGLAAAPRTPAVARGRGRGPGTAAQRLCGKRAFSISLPPCRAPCDLAVSGVGCPGKSLPPSAGGTGDSPPPPFWLVLVPRGRNNRAWCFRGFVWSFSFSDTANF